MANTYFVLIILGIIQAIAEFIPISSSGHLVILEQIDFFKTTLHGVGKAGIMFINVALHLATLFALIIYLWRDITGIVKGFFQGMASKDFHKSEVRIVCNILVASIPAAFIGLVFHDFIENLFSSARIAFILLIINGIILIFTKIIPQKDRKLDEVGLIRSIVIGLCQAFAILPGISRSGMTIAGGMGVGLAPVEAARFSFLMAIPVIIGAGLLEGIKAFRIGFPAEILPALGISAIVCVLVALASLKALLYMVKNIRIYVFGYYTIAVGIIGLAVLYLLGPR